MPEQIISQKYLKEIFHYDPDTGVFTKIESGKEYTNRSSGDYIRIRINSKLYLAHRLAFLYMDGEFPEHGVDHIDHDKSNNKWDNIRHATQAVNMRNQKMRHNNLYGITGVCWDKTNKNWYSRISIDGKDINIGRFKNFFEACCARKSAENRYGFHENHGS